MKNISSHFFLFFVFVLFFLNEGESDVIYLISMQHDSFQIVKFAFYILVKPHSHTAVSSL